MKQVLQSLKTGAIDVADIPVPKVSQNNLLITSTCSLISAGTERMMVDFGKANWINKARQQPEKVSMVVDKVKTDGLQSSIETVLNKLNQPFALGYCNVGLIAEIGTAVNGFKLGERIVSNGKHAEVVSVPKNLCAKIPNLVSNEEASFTVLGAIALQGIRLAKPTLGETVVVTGLGLIGLLTVQLLRAQGCRVLGLDFDKKKLDLAKQFGAEVVNLRSKESPIKAAELFSRGRGVDAVIVTASSKSSEPIHQAALMCRKRGRIILVGVTGLELTRDDFFKKELTFQVSASYGPGRYDPNYEEKGQDYPVGFVRWTEQRNFEAVLDMMEAGYLDVKPLISHQFEISNADKAYKIVGGSSPSLGILLTYPGIKILPKTKTVSLNVSINNFLSKDVLQVRNKISVSFIGSGNYATATLIPAFKKTEVHLRSVASNNGVSGVHAGRKFGFDETTTDTQRIFEDIKTNTVVITTQHDTHGYFILKALRANKNIFVEKPLCLNTIELAEIEAAYFSINSKKLPRPLLMIGFNRRFAPQIIMMKKLLESVTSPKVFIMTINAGDIPLDHWTQDLKVGGGRIIGEACHFIDLLRFLTASPIEKWHKSKMQAQTDDNVTITLNFYDGSIGTIHYYSNGSKSFPKERLEVFSQGRVLQLDNYRKLKAYGWPGFKKMNIWRQDKGQKACVEAFIDAIKDQKPPPIPIDEILEVSKISIQIAEH
ncbi:bi-domain-containing oxidoreductase [Alphaproteobacteria bacterium]|nr:bi-domain-containing oxidoreductase [Alphaproteobacteria bacterium]